MTFDCESITDSRLCERSVFPAKFMSVLHHRLHKTSKCPWHFLLAETYTALSSSISVRVHNLIFSIAYRVVNTNCVVDTTMILCPTHTIAFRHSYFVY
jgi:hypothetical protein